MALSYMDMNMMNLDLILVGDSDSPQDEEQENTEPLNHELMMELIDEVTLGLCFEVHRACKLGTFFLDETDPESEKQYEIVDERGLDVFGQVPMKKTLDCECPHCQRNLAASRFAPHLEKCMGMGRNSSRIASRRIANSGKKESDNESEDNDNDNDWYSSGDRKVKKVKREAKSNNSPRRSKAGKVKNGGQVDSPSVGSVTSEGSAAAVLPYENMTMEERKALLMQTCGVISEHKKKMCTRSHRCPQHSDEQRRAVRIFLLGQHGSSLDADDVHVDIDSYEDGDSQALRDTLQWEAASNPSPADSTSTNNSSSSRKRKKARSQSKKKSQSKSSLAHTGSSSSLYDFT